MADPQVTPSIAATLTVPSPEIAAHVARLGFDVLWVEMGEQMKRRMDEGFTFLEGPTDLGLLALGAENYL